MQRYTLTINPKRQITVPKEAMRDLGVPNGGTLFCEWKSNKTLIIKRAKAKKGLRKL